MDSITRQLQIGNLICDSVAVGSRHTCYLLVPIALDGRLVAMLAKRYGYNLVAVHGIDWDNDLTPWPAPGVFPGESDFRGEAMKFLTLLRERVIPEIEQLPGMDASAGRTLIGVSLSGLFALWAWMQGDDFAHIGSISGSFWYDGFAEWFCGEGIRPKAGNAYFSLGDKEGRDGDSPRFRTVQRHTVQVVDALHRNGIQTVFEQTSGSHFAPFQPRLEKALTAFTGFLPKMNSNENG